MLRNKVLTEILVPIFMKVMELSSNVLSVCIIEEHLYLCLDKVSYVYFRFNFDLIFVECIDLDDFKVV